MRARCECPCNRRTPRMQGARELEAAGLMLFRCRCRACGCGGRHGCHHLIPPQTARRYNGLCWVCMSAEGDHLSARQPTDVDERDPGLDEPASSRLGIHTILQGFPVPPPTPNIPSPYINAGGLGTSVQLQPPSASGSVVPAESASSSCCDQLLLISQRHLGALVTVDRSIVALATGYLTVEAGEEVEILHTGDPDVVGEAGWVYARHALSSLTGWLPSTALPSTSVDVLPDDRPALSSTSLPTAALPLSVMEQPLHRMA